MFENIVLKLENSYFILNVNLLKTLYSDAHIGEFIYFYARKGKIKKGNRGLIYITTPEIRNN